MELSKQIQALRKQKNISLDELAEKIHVTRHSISNWEREKNYPDIHSLVLLSVYFDVSLDELVKGDVPTMEAKLAKNHFKRWSNAMGIFSILAALSIGPALHFLGNYGYAVPIFFTIICMISAFKVDEYKKDNDLVNYKQIIGYMNGKNSKQIKTDKRNDTIMNFLISILYITVLIGLFMLSLHYLR